MTLSRREFLAAAGVSLAAPLAFAEERPMPMRALGKTGVKVSLAGLGCVQVARGDEKNAVEVVRRAVEVGITYIDTAQQYGQGRSEKRVGIALKGGLRDKVFLATKTLQRGYDGAKKDLEGSLERLQTDRVDLWQIHSLRSKSDTDGALKGVLRAAQEAVKEGKARFVGITGHGDPEVFVDALQKHAFDTLLIPLSCIDPHHKSFEKRALPFANAKKTGVIAMKVYCSGKLPGIVKAEDCLRYTYGLPISTCIVGCSTPKEVELAAHVARNLKPMDDQERDALRAKTKPHSPQLEWYKRGGRFGGRRSPWSTARASHFRASSLSPRTHSTRAASRSWKGCHGNSYSARTRSARSRSPATAWMYAKPIQPVSWASSTCMRARAAASSGLPRTRRQRILNSAWCP
jgi:hypothetical protein